MAAATFDTLKFVRRLRADDTFTPQQAERLADALSETAYEDIATKGDVGQVRTEIRELRTELKSDIAEFRTELKGDIAEFRTELKGDIAELRAELKGDIAELRAELKGDIGGLRGELHTGLAGQKAELLKWMFGTVGVQTLVLLGALIALTRGLHP
jgi:hypothetical protein